MKVLIKAIVIIVLTIFIIGVLYLGWSVYDTVKTHKTEISLSNISSDEREKMINLNYLELESYPASLEFITLKKESETRETQFCIIFSISKEENLNEIEKNQKQSANEITIKKISENNEKITYEMKTNFAQNSRDEKWDYLLELINKYKK
mgnify:CR=1 FL=1